MVETLTQSIPLSIPLVDLKRQTQLLKPQLTAAFEDLLTRTDFVGGAAVQRFEAEFARYCGTKHCIGVGNGTDALHLIFKALGLQPGDEVILPSMTFIATGEIFSLMGVRPVFADVDPITYTLDPESVKAQITKKTKAILPVHLYGQPASMSLLQAIADEHGLILIEDAAQGHGAQYEDKPVGSLARAAAFSFYPGKNLGAFGDGGAITTDDDALADKIRCIANHGRTTKYEHAVEGINSRLDTLQAAILSIKLKELDRWNQLRNQWASLYTQQLSGIEGLTLPTIGPDRTHVFHLYEVLTDRRDELLTYLSSQGVNAGIHYPIPLHLQPAFSHLNYQLGQFPVSERLGKTCLSLPLFPEMTEAEALQVCAAVRQFFQR